MRPPSGRSSIEPDWSITNKKAVWLSRLISAEYGIGHLCKSPEMLAVPVSRARPLPVAEGKGARQPGRSSVLMGPRTRITPGIPLRIRPVVVGLGLGVPVIGLIG